MSKTELVEAYSRGEISRRVFIRRLIATGISLGAALVYADTVKAQVAPVSATTADFYPPPENTPGKVTAGGYIDPATSNVTNPATIKIMDGPSVSVGGKGTFGLVVSFQAGDAAPKGNLRYIDHAVKLDVKATSIDTLVIGPGPCGPDTHAQFSGKATVDGTPGQNFQVDVDDCGEPGSSPGAGPDTFKITVTGPSKFYAALGPLIGGNVQVRRS